MPLLLLFKKSVFYQYLQKMVWYKNSLFTFVFQRQDGWQYNFCSSHFTSTYTRYKKTIYKSVRPSIVNINGT